MQVLHNIVDKRAKVSHLPKGISRGNVGCLKTNRQHVLRE